MGMEMRPLSAGTGAVELVTIDRHLYLTDDGRRLVPEGHPDARWLWASPGDERPRDEAERLGAVDPAPPEKDDQVKADGDAKQTDAPTDKRRERTADKSGR